MMAGGSEYVQESKKLLSTNHIQEYLIELSKAKGEDMVNLAALSIIQELMAQDKSNTVKQMFLQKGLLDSLLLTLDKGLESGNLGQLDVSLKSLWLLSQLSVGPLQPLIEEHVIRRLLNLMDIDADFFQYSNEVTTEFQKTCEHANFRGKIDSKQMTTDYIRKIYNLSKTKLGQLTKIPASLNFCKLCDTDTGDKDIDLVQNMATRGLCWSCESSKIKSGDWQNIAVTQVINGPLFWGHIGESKMETVRLIQTFLQMSADELVPGNVTLDNNVVICSKMDDIMVYMRAQILSEDKHMLKVWALDYGFIFEVEPSHVFELPEDISLEKHPPLASLCCLAGIQAVPKCPVMVEVAAAIICNLCMRSFPAGEMTNRLGGLGIIEKLLEVCSEDNINLQVIHLVNNLACNNKVADHIAETELIKIILDKCQEYMYSSDSHKMELLSTSLTCMGNMLFGNQLNRNKFYQNNGIEVALKLMMMFPPSSQTFKLACRLLRIFLWKVDLQPSTAGAKINIDTYSRTKSSRKELKDNKGLGREASKLLRTLSLEEKLLTGTDSVQIVPNLTQNISSDEEDGGHRHGNMTSGDDTDGEPLFSLHGTVSEENKFMSRQQQPLPERYYVLDSMVDFQNNTTHELRPNKLLSKVSASVIAGHVCGMLNTGKGGTIFFGIADNGQVHGVELTRDDKDEFRLGVDKMMTDRIQPCLLHSLFDICYVPVVDIDTETKEHQVVPDLYVIEIVLHPSKSSFYVLTETKLAYYRHGPNSAPLSISELRGLVTFDEEEVYREQIIQLKLELNDLKKM